MRRLGWTLSLAVLCAAACGRDRPTDSATAGRRVVGVTLLTQTHDFYKELEQGLREEAAARGLQLVVTSCEMDPARQASQIEDFVAQGVSAIVVAPCDSSAVAASLATAEQAGIPVFTADIAARGGRVVSHVASDNVQGGRLAGAALARRLGGRGKVLVIDHPTVASAQDRVRGFEEELGKHAEIAIVGRPSSDGQRSKAMAVMEDMLQAHRDVNGVFGINDDSALGAAAVLAAAGRSDVVVVGYDATPEAQRAIREGGPLKADVIQHPRKIGRTVIEMVARHLRASPFPRRWPSRSVSSTRRALHESEPALGGGLDEVLSGCSRPGRRRFRPPQRGGPRARRRERSREIDSLARARAISSRSR